MPSLMAPRRVSSESHGQSASISVTRLAGCKLLENKGDTDSCVFDR